MTKIAYISHHGRFNYELDWLSHIEADEIKILDTNFSDYKEKNNVIFCKVDYKENKNLNKFFHSTASIVKYKNFEKHLENTDVIIVLEVFSSLSKQFVKYAKQANKRCFVLVYELIPNHLIYKIPIFQINTKIVKKHADGYICVSNKAKEHLKKLGFKKNLQVIYPGINIQKFKIIPEIKREKKIFFVGRLDSHKGILEFIEIFQKEKFKGYKKIIIGDGNHKNSVQEICNINSSFNYLGKVNNQDLPEILNSGILYVLPSKDTYKYFHKIGSEQFGFSIVEAMACGLNIVTTDCGALPEIIGTDNINYVANQNSLEDLEQKVDLSLENKSSPNQKNANYIIENYDIQKQAKKILYTIFK